MKISQEDWDRVIEKACDVANATETESDPMYEVHAEGIMALLDELEAKYGQQSRILATRADYLESFLERPTYTSRHSISPGRPMMARRSKRYSIQ
jgi:hypothetical protein